MLERVAVLGTAALSQTAKVSGKWSARKSSSVDSEESVKVWPFRTSSVFNRERCAAAGGLTSRFGRGTASGFSNFGTRVATGREDKSSPLFAKAARTG